MIQPDRSITHTILDDSWSIYIVTEEEAVDIDLMYNDSEDGFRGLTNVDTRSIYIAENCVTREVVTHELFHAYMSYQSLESADLTIDQYEEVVASFLGTNLDKLVANVNKIMMKLNELAKTHDKIKE